MNSEEGARFVVGMTARWAGVNPDDLRRGEGAILEKYGERVMLAWALMDEELRELRTQKVAKV